MKPFWSLIRLRTEVPIISPSLARPVAGGFPVVVEDSIGPWEGYDITLRGRVESEKRANPYEARKGEGRMIDITPAGS